MKKLNLLAITTVLLLSVSTINVRASASTINVKDYGDDTKSIQNAIDAGAKTGKTVDFPAGSYYVNPDVGLDLDNNSSLYFENGAKIISLPSSNEYYHIIKIWEVSNVKIYGSPVIVGDRNVHKGNDGEHGFGIDIENSKSIDIENATISNCWGDGIYLGDDGSSPHYSKDITINNAVMDNNRRQGISIISAINVSINHPKITNTNGTNPQSGIDFEPNYGYQYLQNITVKEPFIQNNANNGIQFYFGLGPFENPVSINIVNAGNVKNNKANDIKLYSDSLNRVTGQIMVDGKNLYLKGKPTIISKPVQSKIYYENNFSKSDMSTLDAQKAYWSIRGGVLNVNNKKNNGGSSSDVIGSENYSVNRTISVDMNVNSIAAGIMFSEATDDSQYNGVEMDNKGMLTITGFGKIHYNKKTQINLKGNKKVNMTVTTDSNNNISVTVMDSKGKVIGKVNTNLNTISGKRLSLSGTRSGLWISGKGSNSFDNLKIYTK